MFNPLQDPVDTAVVRRVLVTKLRHHGDVLLASPVFTVLKRAVPAAEIDALVYRETAPMLEGHPAIAATSHHRPRMEATGLARAGDARNERLLRGARSPALRPDRAPDRAPARRVARPPAQAALLGGPASGRRALALAHELHALLPAAAHHAAPYRRMQPRRAAAHRAAACGLRTSAWCCAPTTSRPRACAICSRSRAWSRIDSSRCTPGRAGCSSAGHRNIRQPCSTGWRRPACASPSPARRKRASARWSKPSSPRARAPRVHASST